MMSVFATKSPPFTAGWNNPISKEWIPYSGGKAKAAKTGRNIARGTTFVPTQVGHIATKRRLGALEEEGEEEEASSFH